MCRLAQFGMVAPIYRALTNGKLKELGSCDHI
jgi:hypothetical protein